MQEQLIADRYKIIALLGKGGMGEVYKAQDPVLGIDVAVKVLPAALAELGAARLQREAIALAKLNHPNIAKVLDFAQTEDQSPYMVLEYLDGQSLDRVIKQNGKLDQKTAIHIFGQICRGLEYAHNSGIIHRDLKPSNILVLSGDEKSPQIKILDFGVAKVASENQKLTSTDALVGSPIYMSPEQIEGSEVNPASDVYSFGCLMFETLTGKPPLKGASAIETLSMHKSKAPPLISEIVPDTAYSNELVNLVDECLSKSPANRPQLSSIKEYLETGKRKPPETAVIEKETAPVEKKKTSSLSILAALAAIIALVAVPLFILTNNRTTIKTSPAKIENPKETPKKSYFPDTSLDEEISSEEKFRYEPLPDGMKVVFSGYPLKDKDLEELKDVNNIRQIKFVNAKFTGSGLQYIVDKPIDYVDLKMCSFKDENCIYFTKMKSLTGLNLTLPDLTDDGVQILKGLNKLYIVSLGSQHLTEKIMPVVSTFSNVGFLTLRSSKFSDKFLESLTSLKRLSSLVIVDFQITPDFGKRIANLKKLEGMNLSHPSNLTPESLKGIEKSNLKNFYIEKCQLNDACLKELLKCKNIKHIEMNECTLDKDVFNSIGENSTLKSLNIFNTEPILIEQINALKKSNVEYLFFKNTNLDDDIAQGLADLKSLQKLSIEGSFVSDKMKLQIAETFRRKNKRNLVVD